jgi:hypothetical protein
MTKAHQAKQSQGGYYTQDRFTVVKTTRVVSLSGLKPLSFPRTELFL